MSKVAMPFIGRHGSTTTQTLDPHRTSSFSRASSLFGAKKKLTKDHPAAEAPSAAKPPAAAPEGAVKNEGISITVIESGIDSRPAAAAPVVVEREGNQEEKPRQPTQAEQKDESARPPVQRQDSNGDKADRDSGKDLSTDERSSGGSAAERSQRRRSPNLSVQFQVDEQKQKPGVISPRMDNRMPPRGPYPPRTSSGMPPAPRPNGPPGHDRRRSGGPFPVNFAAQEGRRPSPPERVPSDGRQENRPPAAEPRSAEPRDSHRDSHRDSTFTLNLPMPAPTDYTVPVTVCHKQCLVKHNRCVRSANVHHRIKCMVCANDLPGERWMCSHCSLRFCTRCKTEFTAGKTFDEVYEKAQAEGWQTMPPPPPAARPAESAPRDNAPARLRAPPNDHRRRPMSIHGEPGRPGPSQRTPPPELQSQRPGMPAPNGSGASRRPPNHPRPLSDSLRPPPDTFRPPPQALTNVSPPRTADTVKAPTMIPVSTPPTPADSRVSLATTIPGTLSPPPEPASLPPPPSSSGTVPVTDGALALPTIVPSETKTTAVSAHSEKKKGLMGRMFSGKEAKDGNKLKKSGSGKTGLKGMFKGGDKE